MGMGWVYVVQSIRYFASILFLCEQSIIIVKYQLFVFTGTPVPVPFKKLGYFSVVIRGMYVVETFKHFPHDAHWGWPWGERIRHSFGETNARMLTQDRLFVVVFSAIAEPFVHIGVFMGVIISIRSFVGSCKISEFVSSIHSLALSTYYICISSLNFCRFRFCRLICVCL